VGKPGTKENSGELRPLGGGRDRSVLLNETRTVLRSAGEKTWFSETVRY